MPYTKQELIALYSLEEDEVNQTLTAAELAVDSESYSDEQIQTRFELIRGYFSSGQVSDYAAATELFQQHQQTQARTKKATLGKKSETLTDREGTESDGQDNPQLNLTADLQEILTMVGSAAIATEEDLLRILNQLTTKRGQAISVMYERMLLTQVAQQLRERQQKRQLFAEFGEQLEAFVEGKSSISQVLPAFSHEPTLKSLPKSSGNS